MTITDLRFELDDGLVQTAWRFAAAGEAKGSLVCLAGGTYDKHYWHLEVPGHPGYSFAEALAAVGWDVIAVDHLGVGGSDDPPGERIGLDRLLEGDVQVAQQIRDQAAHGGPIIGIGHSMGACLTTMVQATSKVYDAVGLLGYGVQIANVREDETGVGDLVARVEASEAAFRAGTGADAGPFTVVPRDVLRPLFHAPDVPDAVVNADNEVQSRVPVRAASEVTTPGFVSEYAARVDVPVYLCFGSVLDVSPDPYTEPANYRSSTDITLHLLEGSAHCHNMASRRQELFNRLATWAETINPR